jgi:LDH2 family malate/lactate/ureidoglycolate dehydrogenase
MATYLADLRSQVAVHGRAVLAPGDTEAREMVRRRATGIPVSGDTWATLNEFATRFGIEVPVPLT